MNVDDHDRVPEAMVYEGGMSGWALLLLCRACWFGVVLLRLTGGDRPILIVCVHVDGFGE